MSEHILVAKEVTIEFGRALDLAVSNYCRYKQYDYGERVEIDYKLLREILRDVAIDELGDELGNPLADNLKKIETIISWNTIGFVVKVAWIEEVQNDLDES